MLELSVKVPLVLADIPEVSAIFLYETNEDEPEPFIIHVAFKKMRPGTRMRLDWKPVIILGNTTVLDTELGHSSGGYPPYLSFRVTDGDQGVELMNRLAALFKLSSQRVRDMRLTSETRNKELNIVGNFPQSEVKGVRAAAYEYARQQAIWMFCRSVEAKQRDAVLEKWPGRHPLRIGATNYPKYRGINVRYAPNGGCILEKHGDEWIVVGG